MYTPCITQECSEIMGTDENQGWGKRDYVKKKENRFFLATWYEQEVNSPELAQTQRTTSVQTPKEGPAKALGAWWRGIGFSPSPESRVEPILFAGGPQPAPSSPGLTWMQVVRQAVLVPRTRWAGQNLIIGAPKNQEEFSLYVLQTELLKVSEKRGNLVRKETECSTTTWYTFG